MSFKVIYVYILNYSIDKCLCILYGIIAKDSTFSLLDMLLNINELIYNCYQKEQFFKIKFYNCFYLESYTQPATKTHSKYWLHPELQRQVSEHRLSPFFNATNLFISTVASIHAALFSTLPINK